MKLFKKKKQASNQANKAQAVGTFVIHADGTQTLHYTNRNNSAQWQFQSKKKGLLKKLLCGVGVLGAVSTGVGLGFGLNQDTPTTSHVMHLENDKNQLVNKGDILHVKAVNSSGDVNWSISSSELNGNNHGIDIKDYISLSENSDKTLLTATLIKDTTSLNQNINFSINAVDNVKKEQANSLLNLTNELNNDIPKTWKLEASGVFNFAKKTANKISLGVKDLKASKMSYLVLDPKKADQEKLNFHIYTTPTNDAHLVVSGYVNGEKYGQDEIHINQELSELNSNVINVSNNIEETLHVFTNFSNIENLSIFGYHPSNIQGVKSYTKNIDIALNKENSVKLNKAVIKSVKSSLEKQSNLHQNQSEETHQNHSKTLSK